MKCIRCGAVGGPVESDGGFVYCVASAGGLICNGTVVSAPTTPCTCGERDCTECRCEHCGALRRPGRLCDSCDEAASFN